MTFQIDSVLASDSLPLGTSDLCQIRLVNDRRWPWLLLVPQIAGLEELHELSSPNLHLAIEEIAFAARVLSRVTACTKINHGALGNRVRQLHFHIVARFEGDANWPDPVWGHGKAQPYETARLSGLRARLQQAFSAGGRFHAH